jgi:hypothetical protein
MLMVSTMHWCMGPDTARFTNGLGCISIFGFLLCRTSILIPYILGNLFHSLTPTMNND